VIKFAITFPPICLKQVRWNCFEKPPSLQAKVFAEGARYSLTSCSHFSRAIGAT
jgi:hypothetical protein